VSDKFDVSGRVALEDAASPVIKKIEANITKMSAATRKVGANFSRFANMGALGGVAQNAKNAMSAVGGLGRSVMRLAAPLAALAGAAGFGGVIYEMQRYITTTDELAKTSLKLGVPVEQLQNMRHAAKLTGVEVASMESAVQILSRSMTAASKGGKNNKQAELFARLGISMKDANGQMRSAADLMPQLAAAFEKNTNATTRMEMATTLMGRGGAEMIKMLAGGPDALKAMYAEMERLGRITAEDAKAAEAAADAQHRFSQAIAGVRNAVAAKLLPSMTKAIDGMTNWTAANREWLATKIDSFIEGFGRTMEKLPWAKMGEGLKFIWEQIDRVVQKFGGWEAMAPVLAGIMVGVLAPAVWFVASAFAGLAIAMATNPIVLVTAAIVGAALLIYKYWDPIKAWFVKLWADIKAAFFAAPEWLANFGSQFAAGFLQDAWYPLVAFFSGLWIDIKNAFWIAFDWIDSFVAKFIPGGIVEAWDALTGVFSTLWNGVKKIFDDAWAWIQPWIDKIMAAIGPVLNAVGKVAGWVGTAGSKIAGGVQAGVAKVFGTPDAAAPAAVPAPASSIYGGYASPVREAANMYGGQAVQAEVNGEVKTTINIAADPSLRVTADSKDRGQVHSTVNVGTSMVPA
jgi:phage-related protein